MAHAPTRPTCTPPCGAVSAGSMIPRGHLRKGERDAMVFAADYPFLNILWSMILFFCWVAWIWILVLILSDLFRRDISGWAKAGWCVVLIILPFLGTLIYLIAH